MLSEHQMQELKNNRELEPFLDVCEDLHSQRKNMKKKIGKLSKNGNTGIIDELIVGHNESVEVAKNQFPDYEFPLTVQLDVNHFDPQYCFHREICSKMRRKYQTGRTYRNQKWTVKNPITAEEKKCEFEKTVQRLVGRNRVCQ